MRKNEPDLVDVKFPSEIIYPKKDILFLIVDKNSLFKEQLVGYLQQYFSSANGQPELKLRNIEDQKSCVQELSKNPDLVIIGDPLDCACKELAAEILSINPRQKVICLGGEADGSVPDQGFGLKKLIMTDSGAFQILNSLIAAHLK